MLFRSYMIKAVLGGMVIPPSTAFIMYSLVAGGASISALFMGGYLVGAWIGRASCRERVSISVVAVSLKKKKEMIRG